MCGWEINLTLDGQSLRLCSKCKDHFFNSFIVIIIVSIIIIIIIIITVI